MTITNRPMKSITTLFLNFALLILLVNSDCPQSCLLCSNSLSCTTCVSQSNLVLVGSSIGCLPCQVNCQKCTSELASVSCKSCSIGYYMNPSNNNCSRCLSTNCDTCNIYEPNLCQICHDGYYLSQSTSSCILCNQSYLNSSTCIENFILTCLTGYFTSNGQTCDLCSTDLSCQKCSSSSICSVCNDGYYLSSLKCQKCDTSCKTCSNANSCSSCNKGYRLNSTSKCQLCSTINCTSCTLLDVCQQCTNGYYLDIQTKKCMSLDSSKFIIDCLKYSNNYNSSITTLYSTSTILCRACISNTYVNIQTNSCQYCSLLCQSCSNFYRSSKCTSCNSDYAYLIDSTNGICTSKNYDMQKNKILYITNRNNPDQYIRSGMMKNITEGKCPGGLLADQSSINIGSFLGYYYNLTVKLLLSGSITNISKINIYVNNHLISTQNVENVKTCSQVQIIKFSTVFLNNPSILLPNSNIIKLVSSNLSSFQIEVKQMIIKITQCQDTCLICSNYSICLMCSNSSQLIQQGKCVSKCQDQFFRYNNSCVSSCKQGYYPNIFSSQWICVACQAECQTCLDYNNCLTCSNGYFLYQKACLLTCPDKYFSNLQMERCEKCTSPCQLCFSSDECTTCSYGFHYSLNNSCLNECPPGYYGNLNNMECQKCIAPCSTCSSPTKCSSCTIKSNLTFYNEQCFQPCPNQYFRQINSSGFQKCVFCEFPCEQCIQSKYKCTKCMSGFILNTNFTCVSSCPDNYFSSKTYKACIPCQSPCKTCLSNQKQCLSCISSYYINMELFTCSINCTSGYYIDYPTNSCKSCRLECSACLSYQVCSICIEEYYFYQGMCLLNCPENYFSSYTELNNGICLQCSSQCSTCFGKADYCLTCSSYFILQQNNTCLSSCSETELTPACIPCEYPCYSCSNSTSLCTSCSVDYYFFNPNNQHQCVTQCYEGYYKAINLGFGYCLPCISPCKNCFNNQTCLQCENVNQTIYYLKSLSNSINTICVKQCGLYEYKDNLIKRCLSCEQPCKTCSDKTHCTSCENGILSNGNCINNFDGCPIGQFAITSNITIFNLSTTMTTCQKCPEYCLSCISNKICTGCLQNYYLYQNSCIKTCPIGTAQILSLRKCLPCEYPCQQCLNSTSYCTKCYQISLVNQSIFTVCPQNRKYGNYCIKYYLYSGNCYSECSSITYSSKDQCLSCISPCFTCSSSTACTSCVKNTFMLQNSCYKQCPDRYYQEYQSQQCQKCIYPCKTCIDELQCITCSEGYLFQNRCLTKSSCPIYYFETSSDAQGSFCEKCNEDCISCKNEKDYCTQCTTKSFFQGNCLDKCPDSYYTHKIPSQYISNTLVLSCQKCSSECLTCVNEQSCSSCSYSYKFLNNKCLVACPLNYMQRASLILFQNTVTYSVIICSQCIYPCSTCFGNETRCESCSNGYYLYNNQCQKTCPNFTYNSSISSSCRLCPFPCKFCQQINSTVYCINCRNGYYLQNGLCVDQCYNDEFIDSNFEKCVSNCSGQFQVFKQNSDIKYCAKQCNLPYIKNSLKTQCILKCPDLEFINAEYTCTSTILTDMKRISIPNVKYHLFQNQNGFLQIYIEFNRQVQYTNSQSFDDMLDINYYLINLTAPLSDQRRLLSDKGSYIISYRIVFSSSTIFSIQLYPSIDIYPNSYITMDFKENSNLYIIDKLSKIPFQNNTLTFSVGSNRYETYGYDKINNRFNYIGEIITDFILLMGMVALIFNRFAKFYHLLIYFQSIFMLICLDIKLPPNLENFLKGFKFSHFYQIKNIFIDNQSSQKYTNFTDNLNHIQSIFNDANFLSVAGHIIFLYILIMLLFVSLYSLQQLLLSRFMPNVLNKYSQLIANKIGQKLKFIKWSYITDIFMVTFMLPIAAFFIQLINYEGNKIQQNVGMFLASLIIVMLIAYLIYFIYKSYKINKMSEEQPQKFIKKHYLYREDYVSYFEGINTPQNLMKNYLLILKISIYGILTGICWDFSNFCLSIYLTFQIYLLLIYLFRKPYADEYQNYLYTANGFFHSLSLIFIIIINQLGSSTQQTSESLSQDIMLSKAIKQKKWIFGYFAIVFILISTFILLLQMIISIIRGNLIKKRLEAEENESIDQNPNKVEKSIPNISIVIENLSKIDHEEDENKQFQGFSLMSSAKNFLKKDRIKDN